MGKTLNITIFALCAALFTAAAALIPSSAPAQTTASTDYDKLMRQYSLVDVRDVETSLRVELRYATENNFVGENMYGTLRTAYLLPHIARKLAEAQKILHEEHPDYSLLIYDAARPLSAQRRMRRAVEGTGLEAYVADAARGGRHNYGAAVDLTIADAAGKPLDMGTDFDFFGRPAWVGWSKTVTYEGYIAFVDALAANGTISKLAAANRKLLIRIMNRVGLRPYAKEWWHYQEPISMPRTRELYKLLDF